MFISTHLVCAILCGLTLSYRTESNLVLITKLIQHPNLISPSLIPMRLVPNRYARASCGEDKIREDDSDGALLHITASACDHLTSSQNSFLNVDSDIKPMTITFALSHPPSLPCPWLVLARSWVPSLALSLTLFCSPYLGLAHGQDCDPVPGSKEAVVMTAQLLGAQCTDVPPSHVTCIDTCLVAVGVFT